MFGNLPLSRVLGRWLLALHNVVHERCYWGQVILTSVVFGSSAESISNFLREFSVCSTQTLKGDRQ